MARRLTTKQERFIQAYDGNGTKACRLAGYKGSDNALAVMSRKLLRIGQIKSAISKRESKVTNPLISSREARQQFWIDMMMDTKASRSDRLRASDLLGKSCADFTNKVELEVGKTLEDLLSDSRKD